MHFRQQDAVALLAIPLLVAAFKAGGAAWPTICLSLAGAVIVFAVASHEELSRQRRIATGAVIFAVDLGMVVFLYRVNLAQALNEQVAAACGSRAPEAR